MHAIQLIVMSLWRHPQASHNGNSCQALGLRPLFTAPRPKHFKELSYCIAQKFDSGNLDEWPAICQVLPTNLCLLMFFL